VQQVPDALVRAAFHEPDQTLEIEFHEGGVYQYFTVPGEVSAGLLRAPSHGKYFWANIRHRYPYKKITQRVG
jgi:hypothetical protein